MGSRVRSALLAAATLAAGAAAEPADAPELLVTLEVSGGPLPTGFVASALPTRFVLFEDGQVFVGGISQLAAGHLDKTEVKAFEQRLAALRKLPGLASTIAFGGAPAPRSRLLAPKSKLDVVTTGDPAAAPSALRPLGTLVRDLSSFHHPSLRPYEPAALLLSVKEGPAVGGCRPWSLPVPLAEALAGPRTVSANEARDWPTGATPAAVCDGDRRFVVTLRPLLPGERP
jgi:hypothetical protein